MRTYPVHRASSRGFTMTEMLAVLAMISVLVVAASPIFINMMRDRRVNRAAMQLVDLYRTARTRAMGRNLPILVTWDVNGGAQIQATGLATMLEPDVTLFAQARSCLGTQWGTVAAHEIYRFDVGNGLYEHSQLAFFDDNVNPQGKANICFSGRGRTYIQLNGVFAPLTGPVKYTVTNGGAGGTGLVRTVFIPPNGAARLAQ